MSLHTLHLFHRGVCTTAKWAGTVGFNADLRNSGSQRMQCGCVCVWCVCVLCVCVLCVCACMRACMCGVCVGSSCYSFQGCFKASVEVSGGHLDFVVAGLNT